jgi:hypothetical protein
MPHAVFSFDEEYVPGQRSVVAHISTVHHLCQTAKRTEMRYPPEQGALKI